jgi:hypothetical protein
MINFLSNTLTFPTVFYTGLLILVFLYWLISAFGFLEFETVETDVDIDSGELSGIATWLTKFRLDGIPFTLTLSLVIFISWVLCLFIVPLLIKEINSEWVRIALGFWMLILAPTLAVPVTAILLSPLRPLFKKLRENDLPPTAESFIGAAGSIRSEKVNQSYGTAEVADGGAGLILQIRADEPNNYQRNNDIILTSYLAATNTYLIRHQ